MLAYHRERIKKTFLEFRISKKKSLYQWTIDKRVLGPANPRPGRWDFDLTPYLIEPHKDFNDENVSMIVLKLASQMGKTEMFNNICAYLIDENPAPALMIFPKDELAEAFSRIRFNAMVDAMPFLSRKIIARRDRNSTSGQKRVKVFMGGFILMGGSNSPSNVSSWPVRVAIGDEIDRYAKDIKGEGSAIDLIQKRLSNFDNSKFVLGSTPATVDDSNIEKLYNNSSSGLFNVPCPLCKEFIVFKFENLTIEDGNAYHRCPACKELVPESHRVQMVRSGKWVHRNPNIKNVKGYEISALYNIFQTDNVSWRSLKDEYDESLKDETKRKSFVNTREARPYGFSSSDFVDWQDLHRTASDRPIIPDPLCLITCAVDVQADRLEYEVHFWGARYECSAFVHGAIKGDPMQHDVWHKLATQLSKKYGYKKKKNYSIDIVGIDTGYLSDRAFGFVKAMKLRRQARGEGPQAVGLRGTHTGETVIKYAPESSYLEKSTGKKRKRKARYLINVNMAKDLIFKAIKSSYRYKIGADKEKPKNYYYDWSNKSEWYYKQLASEEPKIVVYQGLPKTRYEKRPGFPRNEILDLWVYNFALACHCFKGDVVDDDYWRLISEKLKKS